MVAEIELGAHHPIDEQGTVLVHGRSRLLVQFGQEPQALQALPEIETKTSGESGQVGVIHLPRLGVGETAARLGDQNASAVHDVGGRGLGAGNDQITAVYRAVQVLLGPRDLKGVEQGKAVHADTAPALGLADGRAAWWVELAIGPGDGEQPVCCLGHRCRHCGLVGDLHGHDLCTSR